MTYTLRIYSRDNEGISSTSITFTTGERGPGPAVPCKHGHSILILSFLLDCSREGDPPHPSPPRMACQLFHFAPWDRRSQKCMRSGKAAPLLTCGDEQGSRARTADEDQVATSVWLCSEQGLAWAHLASAGVWGCRSGHSLSRGHGLASCLWD